MQSHLFLGYFLQYHFAQHYPFDGFFKSAFTNIPFMLNISTPEPDVHKVVQTEPPVDAHMNAIAIPRGTMCFFLKFLN